MKRASAKKPAATKTAPPACFCIAEINPGLARRGLRLHTPLVVNRTTGQMRPPEVLVVVETLKTGSIPRYGHVAIIYCPWCGTCLRPDRCDPAPAEGGVA